MNRSDEFESAIERAADLSWKVFADHGWLWGSGEGAHIPNHDEIQDALSSLVDDMRGHGPLCSGRFIVSLESEGDHELLTIALTVGEQRTTDRTSGKP